MLNNSSTKSIFFNRERKDKFISSSDIEKGIKESAKSNEILPNNLIDILRISSRFNIKIDIKN